MSSVEEWSLDPVKRSDKIAITASVAGFGLLAVLALVLQLRYGEALYFGRVIASLAGCL